MPALQPKDIQTQILPKPVQPSDLVGNDNWRNRRITLWVALAFMGGVIAHGAIWGADTAINQQVCVSMVAAATSLIAAYVFGAVWDDHNKRMFFKSQPGRRDEEETN